jgi:hypothetical protein
LAIKIKKFVYISEKTGAEQEFKDKLSSSKIVYPVQGAKKPKNMFWLQNRAILMLWVIK